MQCLDYCCSGALCDDNFWCGKFDYKNWKWFESHYNFQLFTTVLYDCVRSCVWKCAKGLKVFLTAYLWKVGSKCVPTRVRFCLCLLLDTVGCEYFYWQSVPKNFWDRVGSNILTFFILLVTPFGILIVFLSLSLLTAGLFHGTWNLRSKIQFELNITMFQVNLCFRSCLFLTFVYCSSSVDVYNSLFLLFFFLLFRTFLLCPSVAFLGASCKWL